MSVYDCRYMALSNVAIDMSSQTSLMDNKITCKFMTYQIDLDISPRFQAHLVCPALTSKVTSAPHFHSVLQPLFLNNSIEFINNQRSQFSAPQVSTSMRANKDDCVRFDVLPVFQRRQWIVRILPYWLQCMIERGIMINHTVCRGYALKDLELWK